MVLVVKNPPASAADIRDVGSIPGSKEPLEEDRARQPTPVFLPGESHGQKSLVGYVHRVAHSQTCLKRLSRHAHIQL